MSKKTSEELNKSIDALIDEIFVEKVTKAMDIELAGDSKTKADDAVSKAPSSQKDEARAAGRPKQISDVPQTDQDGKRASEYDSAITEDSKESDQTEASQVKEANQIKNKGGNDASKPQSAPFKKSEGMSEADWNEFQAFKKAKAEKESEALRKADEDRQSDLIKSVVEKTVEKMKKGYEEKIEGLQKSLNEQNRMVKAMAESPRTAKTITNIEVLEKGTERAAEQRTTFSKSEMMDAAEELHKAGKLQLDQVVELDNNGYIYDSSARKTLEQYLARKG